MITLSKYKKGIKAAAIALSICSSGMMVTSCNDFLEMDPHNIITEDMFWNEKADVEQILMGCYSTMTQRAIVSRMMVWGEFRSENVNVGPDCGANDVNLERVLKENITAMNGYTAYGDFYTVINRCNIIIKHAPQVAAKDPSYSQSQLKAIGLDKISFYASANNLFVLTKYTGADPDISASMYYPAQDRMQTPRPRSFTFGMTVDF